METEEIFIEAIKKGDLAQLEQLLDQRPDLLQHKPPGELSPALLAIYYNELEVAQFLVQRGAPLDIFAASGCGALGQVQALVEAEPGLAEAVAADGFQPLGLAAFFGQIEIVRFQLELVRLLLDHGAEINARKSDGQTPVALAIQYGHPDLAELLKRRGAEI